MTLNFEITPYTTETTKINLRPNLNLNAESQGTVLERVALNFFALGRILDRPEMAH